MQMTLYSFIERKSIIKFITMSRQHYFEINNEIKRSLILSRDVLLF